MLNGHLASSGSYDNFKTYQILHLLAKTEKRRERRIVDGVEVEVEAVVMESIKRLFLFTAGRRVRTQVFFITPYFSPLITSIHRQLHQCPALYIHVGLAIYYHTYPIPTSTPAWTLPGHNYLLPTFVLALRLIAPPRKYYSHVK